MWPLAAFGNPFLIAPVAYRNYLALSYELFQNKILNISVTAMLNNLKTRSSPIESTELILLTIN
jgi:hypothetical protein